VPVRHCVASAIRVLEMSCGSSILYFSKSSKISVCDSTSAFQFYKQTTKPAALILHSTVSKHNIYWILAATRLD